MRILDSFLWLRSYPPVPWHVWGFLHFLHYLHYFLIALDGCFSVKTPFVKVRFARFARIAVFFDGAYRVGMSANRQFLRCRCLWLCPGWGLVRASLIPQSFAYPPFHCGYRRRMLDHSWKGSQRGDCHFFRYFRYFRCFLMAQTDGLAGKTLNC